MEDKGLAKVAADMASSLWYDAKGSSPKKDDWQAYIQLVRACSNALQGKPETKPYSLEGLL